MQSTMRRTSRTTSGATSARAAMIASTIRTSRTTPTLLGAGCADGGVRARVESDRCGCADTPKVFPRAGLLDLPRQGGARFPIGGFVCGLRRLRQTVAPPPGMHLEQGPAELGEAVRWRLEHAEHGRQFVVAESERAFVGVDGSPDVLGQAEVARVVQEQCELCDGSARDLDPGDGHVTWMPFCHSGKRVRAVAAPVDHRGESGRRAPVVKFVGRAEPIAMPAVRDA